MFSFFSSQTELEAVFDIGSSSVRGGLVRKEKGKAPHIEFTVREAIPFPIDLTPKRFFQAMISALDRANTAVVKASAGRRVRRVAYAFSSPWSATQTKVATIERPEPFVLTKAIADEVISQAEKTFEAEALHTTPDGVADRLVTMERRVIQVLLNGYPVTEPYGKKARRADISFFTSIVPKAVIDKVFETSMKAHHPKGTSAYSFPLVAFSLLRDIHHDLDDFIFLDVGGELTDVSAVKNGLIVESASFPLGFNFLIRSVSKAFAMSPEQSESLLRLHFEEHGDDNLAKKLEPVLIAASKEWANALHGLLTRLSDAMSLPQKLFLIVGSDLVRFFVESAKDEKVAQLGLEEVPFSVTLLNADKLKGHVTFAPNTRKDPLIAMITAFLHTHGALEGEGR
ncbi:MAG: hypothetical protein Q8L64_04600 [bacterium]|nr:hypothetical protein [bacterium]